MILRGTFRFDLHALVRIGLLLMCSAVLASCAIQRPMGLAAQTPPTCEELENACRSTCSGPTRCNIDCDAICTQDVHATHCQYDSGDHSCRYTPCNDGTCEDSGSTQPTYSDCLAHCANASSSGRAQSVVLDLVLLNCAHTGAPNCGGGDLEDQQGCHYVPATGACHAVSCPSDQEHCSDVGSSQPNENACFAHCSANP